MKKTRLARFVSMALTAPALVLSAAAAAEPALDFDDADVDDAVELEATYVRPDYVEVERLRNTKEVIVLAKEDIQEKGNRTLSDALSKVPSVMIGASGSGTIDIRGQGANNAARNIQILVDGAPITKLVTHPLSTNYDVIPVEEIDRIEVIPGGGSVMYGAGTAGGVINITTSLKSMREPTKSVSAEYNDKGYRLDAKVGHRINDKWIVEGTATKLDRDLWFVDTYSNSEYYSLGSRLALTDRQNLTLRASYLTESSQFVKQANVDAIKKYGHDYRPGSNLQTVGLDENGHKIKKLVPGYTFADRRQHRVSGTYDVALSDTLHYTNDFFYEAGNFKGNNDLNNTIYDRTKGTRNKLEWEYRPGWSLLLGADWTEQNAVLQYDDYKHIGGGKYRLKPLDFIYNKEMYALYASNRIEWKDFEFTQGARRELTKWSFNKTLPKLETNFIDTKDCWNNAFELAAGYKYRDTGRVYARYEKGFTLPDGMQITEETVVDGHHVYRATPAKDETYDLYEIGLSDDFGVTTANIAVWASETKNQIDRVMWFENKVFQRQTKNLINTKRWGVDANFMQRFKRLTLEEGLAYMKGKADYNGQAAIDFIESHKKKHLEFASGGLEKVPEFKATVRANYDFTDRLSADVTYVYTGKYQNYSYAKYEENGMVKDYGVVNLGFKWQPKSWMNIYGGVTNVFNKTYYEYQSDNVSSPWVTPGADRGFFIGLKATY